MTESVQVTASGDRSIAVGGDAVGALLVTGDNNTFFVGRYERLQDAYLDPQVLHRELNLDLFTGRGWLAAAVDAFVERRPCGYLVIEADAGLGKSTFLAWLARERGYVTHFVRLMTDPDDVGVAMRNLSAQLIRAWDLETYAVGGVLPPAAHRPQFFQEVLAAAAAKREGVRPGEPIVVVVDGLDETTPVSGQNPLGLPASLPAGVYVVVSQRTVHVPLRIEVPRSVVRIEPHGEENQRDVELYLRTRAAAEPIAGLLRTAGVSADQFVDTLVAKSGGVWVYLHYVLAEVAHGRLLSEALDELPTGLWQYYAQHWRGWQRRHAERWPGLDLPLLSTLAAAAEPLPTGVLAALAGVNAGSAEDLLDDWRPFLETDELGDPPRYQLFHASLREFLSGAVPADDWTSGERSFIRRLAASTRTAHGRIADGYLDRWGGVAGMLPGLATDRGAEIDAGYGLRQVVHHLLAADRLDDAHALLTMERDARNAWFAVRSRVGDIDGYRRDVAAVWAAVRRTDGPLRDAHQLRYALFAASLNSLTEATPPALWSLLVAQGKLSPRAAMDYARRIPTPEDRAEALTCLVSAIPAALRDETEREAIAAVRAVPDEFWRVGELWRLYPTLTGERREAALAVVRSLVDPYFQVVAYRLLGYPELAPAMTPRAGHGFESLDSPSGVSVSGAFVDDYRRRREVAATRLDSAGFLASRASGLAADPVERYWAAHCLTVAAASAGPERVRALVEQAVANAADIGSRPEVTRAWEAVGRVLAAKADDRRWAIETLVPALPGVTHQVALHLALTADDPADSPAGDPAVFPAGDPVPATMLIEVAPALARCGTARTVALARPITGPTARARLYLAVAEAGCDEPAALAAAVLEMVESEPDLPGREGLVARAAVHLDDDGVRRALALTERWDDALRAGVRSALAVRLCALGEIDAALAVPADRRWRTDVSAALAEAMLDRGDAAGALALTDRIGHRDRRATIFARAAPGAGGDPAGTALDRLFAMVAETDEVSRVAILGRACGVTAGATRDQLLTALLQAAEAIDDHHDRAVALNTVVGSLVAAGRPEEALAHCARITVDVLRAEALCTVLGAPTRAVLEAATSQAAGLGEQRARTLVRLAALRAAARAPQFDPPIRKLFDEAVADLADGTRDLLLAHLPDLLAVAGRTAISDAARTVATELLRVQRWWP